MQNRWDEFIYQMSITTSEELEAIPVKVLKLWLKEWATYIKSGGIRPDKPH